MLKIEDSSDEEEEEEPEDKQPEKVTIFKKPTSKTRQPWKPKIEKVNIGIVNKGNFAQINKFYDLNNDIEKEQIYISIVRYMITNKLKLESIKGFVNQKVYDRLIEKKTVVHEEDMEI